MATIEALKSRVERVLRHRLQERMEEGRALKLYFGSDAVHLRASISPLNKVGIAVASDIFRGLDAEQRNELFWSLLDPDISDTDAEEIDFWQTLTLDEASMIFPDLLKRRMAAPPKTRSRAPKPAPVG